MLPKAEKANLLLQRGNKPSAKNVFHAFWTQ